MRTWPQSSPARRIWAQWATKQDRADLRQKLKRDLAFDIGDVAAVKGCRTSLFRLIGSRTLLLRAPARPAPHPVLRHATVCQRDWPAGWFRPPWSRCAVRDARNDRMPRQVGIPSRRPCLRQMVRQGCLWCSNEDRDGAEGHEESRHAAAQAVAVAAPILNWSQCATQGDREKGLTWRMATMMVVPVSRPEWSPAKPSPAWTASTYSGLAWVQGLCGHRAACA